jgi:hypothetical protein
MSDITDTLQEIKSQESNSFMENSYIREIDYQISIKQDNNISVFYSDEHIFKQDTNTYIHISLNPGYTDATALVLDLLCLQVCTEHDGWKTICSEPIKYTKNNENLTEIDMHGFFYAGSKIRTWTKKLGTNSAVKSSTNTVGYMSIVETSNEKPFPTKSFTWRTEIPKNTSGKTVEDNKSKPN